MAILDTLYLKVAIQRGLVLGMNRELAHTVVYTNVCTKTSTGATGFENAYIKYS